MAGNSLKPRDLLLKPIDIMRGIPGIMGVRLYTVAIIVRAWTGARPGLGSPTDATHGVKVDVGIYQTKVAQVSAKDAIASGGLYTNQELKVGPITPPYTGSTADNDAIAILDPPEPSPGTSQEVLFNIQGPGFPTALLSNGYAGAWFEKVSSNYTRYFRYEFIVRKLSVIA